MAHDPRNGRHDTPRSFAGAEWVARAEWVAAAEWVAGDAKYAVDMRRAAECVRAIVHSSDPPGYRNRMGLALAMTDDSITTAEGKRRARMDAGDDLQFKRTIGLP